MICACKYTPMNERKACEEQYMFNYMTLGIVIELFLYHS